MQHAASTRSLDALIGIRWRIKVVDIGANPTDGTPPYHSLLRAGHADVVGSGPNPEALARLGTMQGPNEIYLPHAVADGQRTGCISVRRPA